MKTQKKNKTKGLISLSLYALLLRNDYNDITVKEICDKSGVSRMSFYRYYNKKDDIFVDYCDERFEEFYNEISANPPSSVRDFTLAMFKFISRYKRQIQILEMANREFMLLNQLNNYSKYVLMNLKSDYLREQKNNPIFAYFMSGGLFNVVIYWINHGAKISPIEMNDLLYNIVDKKEI